MKIFEKYKKKWLEKSIYNKIGDGIFVVLIVLLIIPSSRFKLMGFVSGIRAEIVQPTEIKSNDTLKLTENDYLWQLKSITGEDVNLLKFKEKVLFINFWATWCPPCVGEMPGIQNLFNEFKNNEAVQFIILTNEDPEKVKTFLKKYNYTLPFFTSIYKTPDVFETNTIPATYVISSDGKIVVKEFGAANWDGEKSINLIKKLIKDSYK